MAGGWTRTMRFDIYGRFELEVVRESGRWTLYKLDHGKRRATSDFVMPASLRPDELSTYLDDMLHEWAQPGAAIRRID